MKFLHLTDLHLCEPGRSLYGRDPWACFEQALGHALDAHPDAGFIAITGDLAETGAPGEYARLRERLAATGLPAHLIVGNHDDRANFLAAFPDMGAGDGFAQHAADIGGHRCLFLDTLEPGQTGGRLCATRLGWLQAELAGPGPFLVFLHHQPVPSGLAKLDDIGLADAGAFRALMARHAGRVRHIFFGHCHMMLSGACGGVPCAALRSTHVQFLPPSARPGDIVRAALPGAYGVATLGPDWISYETVDYGALPG